MPPRDGADKEFLSEAEELIEALGRELMRYEEAINSPSTRVDPDILNGIFRAAHSLKGLAGMFGFTDLGGMAHSMENLLDRMRLGKVQPGSEVLDILFSGVETLKNLLAGEEDGAKKADEVLKLLEDTAAGKLPKAAKKAPEAPPPAQPAALEASDADVVVFEGVPLPKSIVDVLTEYEEFRLLENIRSGINLVSVHAPFDITTFDTDLPNLMDWLKKQGEVITTLPGAAETDGEHIHFDLLVGVDLPTESLKSDLERMGYSMSVLNAETKTQPVEEPESPPGEIASPTPAAFDEDDESKGESSDADTDKESARSVSRTVRVDIGRLDLLMNIVGELVLEKSIIGNIRDRLSQEVGLRTLANELYKAHRALDRKLAELQEAVMDVRMVPVGQLFGRLGRIVRKLGREQRKEVELIRSGMDTELDKLIIEELADPLMHIIRNAIDHGIEPSGMRERRGKPAKGRIELHAYQQGNHVVIEVYDDGAGIDAEKVHAKAIKMGMVAPEAELSNQEIFNFLFEPGFSTKDSVSELSGRGVGLDVVKRNISNLSGLIEVDSVPGEGSAFVITLPITLAIIQALIVECVGRTYALPLNSVRECHILGKKDIKTIEQREVMELREQTIPLLRLGALFGYDEDNGGRPTEKLDTRALEPVPQEFTLDLDEQEEDEDKQFVVIVGIADMRMGVIVDRMVGRQDVVIKSLGSTLGDIRGVAGATDLGNQQTVLVLDVGDLLGEIGHSSERGADWT